MTMPNQTKAKHPQEFIQFLNQQNSCKPIAKPIAKHAGNKLLQVLRRIGRGLQCQWMSS